MMTFAARRFPLPRTAKARIRAFIAGSKGSQLGSISSSQYHVYRCVHRQSTAPRASNLPIITSTHSNPTNDRQFSSQSIHHPASKSRNEIIPPPTTNSNKHDEGPISAFVKNQIENGQLQEDPEQQDLAYRLDALLTDICRTDASVVSASKLSMDWFLDAPPKGALDKLQIMWRGAYLRLSQQATTTTPRGMYIFGSVGVGKSFLMDLFCAELQIALTTTTRTSGSRRKVRRAHFHEFMLDIHQRIHEFKKLHPKDDPLPAVALSLAQEARILCLDEFQVTDIADATILKRLFSMLWMDTTRSSSKKNNQAVSGGDMGMVVIATSNRDPDSLYEGGLNRSVFLPFIDTLKRHMTVVGMGGAKDYRREKRVTGTDDAIANQQCYFWPADDAQTRLALDGILESSGTIIETSTKIPVRMGRHVTVPRSTESCAWFDFGDLCDQPLGAADYLAICERYPTLIIDNVPQLDESCFNEARRFVTLIDAVYESKTRLVLASAVPLNELLLHFEATLESTDGDEEIAGEEIQNSSNKTNGAGGDIFVKGEGGSSSSSATTMIQTKEGEVEWSATGRVGVSLAQFSAVQEVSFSFQRAESRLVEMNNGTWGRT